VGLDALLLRQLAIRARVWLGMAARRIRHVAWRNSLCRRSGGISSSCHANRHSEYGGGRKGRADFDEGPGDQFGGEPRIGRVGNCARISEQPATFERAGGEDGLGATGNSAAVFGEFDSWGRVWAWRSTRNEFRWCGTRECGVRTCLRRGWQRAPVSNF